MTYWKIVFCLFFLFLFIFTDAVLIASFQKNGTQSDSHLLWQRKWNVKNSVSSLTLCARFKFSTLWETNCFIQLDDEDSEIDLGNHQPISAVLDLQSLWFSIGGFRTRHKLKSRFVAFTWYHACVTYSHKFRIITSYLDGKKQDSFNGTLQFPITGSRFKVGSCTKEKSFQGEVTQVNVWDRVLSGNEISELSNCKSDELGNIVSWDGEWKDVGDISRTDEDNESFCRDTNGPNYFLFPPMSMNQAYAACKSITGLLPVPQSKEELNAYQDIITDTPSFSKTGCDQYWVDVTDSGSEGKWTRKNGNAKKLFWATRQPDGQDTENCAIMKFGKSGGIYDTKCSEAACSICVLETTQIWSLMGTCEKYQRNRYFVAVQDKDGQIVFKGYSDYEIMQDKEGTWVWKNGKENTTIATLASVDRTSDVGHYPFGRKKWTTNLPICDNVGEQKLTVLLTPCKDDEYTCNDASCIPLWQRCDLKPNCIDQSDEQECSLIDIPLSYRADIPPLSTEENTSLPISLQVILESIDIHTADMRMHVNINLTMTWTDSRVEYRNLNQDRTLNRVKYETMKQMWVPVVDFTNTRGNHITQADEQATMSVNMKSTPTIGGDSQPEEVEFYAGGENSISIIRKYSELFQCHFDLSRYPFDAQICQMELTMLSASSRLLQFGNDSSAKFIGNAQLVEYTVKGVEVDIQNDLDFSILFVEVELVRRAGFILMNVYVPSLCLLIITYLTLYFKPAIFQVRVLATLTSLLVMTTLFTQASSHLPKTSYFKSVDVWLLTSLIIIFTVILCHIIIDNTIDDTPKMPFKSSISKLVKRKPETSLPMTSVSPVSKDGGSFNQATFQEVPKTSSSTTQDSLEEDSRIPWTRYFIVSSRLFVLFGIVLFNIGYWTVALSSQE